MLDHLHLLAFSFQVDEVINISCSLRERYKNAPPGLKRCLKLSMTDGVQHVFGMEYRPIKSLEVLVPAGFKVFLYAFFILAISIFFQCLFTFSFISIYWEYLLVFS